MLALKVLARKSDELKLFIRMTRRKIVTVTDDTEHVVEYSRHAASRASSRSVATRIAEVDGAGTPAERVKVPGEDRGFLWRLNSYWRYEKVDGGVIVGARVAHAEPIFWHERITWPGLPGEQRFKRWLAFSASAGAFSVVTNVAVTLLVAHLTALPLVPANIVAVVVASTANFWVSDRLIFRTRR